MKAPLPNSQRGRGRPPKTSRGAIIEAGVQVGLPDLRIKAVADRLGVTAGALYHHVDDLLHLRRLVGNEIASTIKLPGDAADPVDYLVQLGRTLRDTEALHPGIGRFFSTDGQDCEATRQLLVDSIDHLSSFGLAPQDAHMVASIITNTAIGFASHDREVDDEASRALSDSMLGWVLQNLAASLISNLDSAPWNLS